MAGTPAAELLFAAVATVCHNPSLKCFEIFWYAYETNQSGQYITEVW